MSESATRYSIINMCSYIKEVIMIKYIGTFLLAICLAGSAAADDTGLQQRHWLQGVAFRYEGLRADIQADMKTAETQAAKARNLMSRAQAAHNAAAQDMARRSLTMAEKTQAMNLERLRRVEAELQQVRELLALPGSRLAKVNSFVTGIRGEVKIRRAGSDQWANADGAALQTLAAGDVIATGNDGSIKVQLHDAAGLDSRLKLGADTTLKVQASEPGLDDSLELFLEKGSLYRKVKTTSQDGEAVKRRRRDYTDQLLRCLQNDPSRFLDCMRITLKESLNNPWQMRLPSAVLAERGTEFVLEVDGQGNSQCVVFDGSVIYFSPKRGKVVVVEKGQSVTMNSEGEFSPVKRLDVNESKGWWSE